MPKLKLLTHTETTVSFSYGNLDLYIKSGEFTIIEKGFYTIYSIVDGNLVQVIPDQETKDLFKRVYKKAVVLLGGEI
jgi:hypothetical protein